MSRSSVEAKYRAVANGVSEACWLQALLNEQPLLTCATIVYCDNVSVVYLSSNPIQDQHTKHEDINIHFVHEKVVLGRLQILHPPSSQ